MKYFNFSVLRNIDLHVVIKKLYTYTDILSKNSINTKHYQLPNNKKIAITGSKWIDNTTKQGGIGAIDLVMYIESISLREAAEKLETIQYINDKVNVQLLKNNNEFVIPLPCDETWTFVNYYLTKIRFIPETIVNDLFNQKLVWSDKNKNCVFPRDLNSGAFLRGTLPNKPFKLSIGKNGNPYVIPGDKLVIITEAPIDAISLKYYYPNATIIATGGIIGLDKLEQYLKNAIKVLLAQDNDNGGNYQASRISKIINTNVERLCPPTNFKDWNDYLKFDIVSQS
jgi:hypothetical protein